jgi:glycosyltransferase involved in cell wall biosynthesis
MAKKDPTCLVFVIPGLEYGGAETMMIQQINYLQERGFKIGLIILSRGISADLYRQLTLPPQNILQLNAPSQGLTLSAIGFAFSVVGSISEFIQKIRPHSVIANLPLSHFQMRLVRLYDTLRGQDYKLINYHHSLQYQANPLNSILKRIFNEFNALLARITDDKSIFISEAVKRDISDHFYVNRRATVIPNSIPERHIGKKEGVVFLKKIGLDDKRYNIILIPGRIHPVKGHFFFLNAFVELKRNYPEKIKNYKVLIAGGGTYLDDLKQKIDECGVGNEIWICGKISNDIMLSLYKCAKLVIIPSIYEGFGNVAIEGLMQQSTMLVSDAGGLDEIIEHGYNGYKFTANDQRDFLNKLTKIINNQGLKPLQAGNMLDCYKSNYTLPKQLERIMEFIND